MSKARKPPRQLRGLRPEQRAAIPPFHAVRAFEAIVTSGGIRRAADMLSVDHATVSRHLRALEEWVGVVLVDRAPGAGGRLTAPGEAYFARIADALAEIGEASLEIRARGDDTHLSLVCSPGLASEWLTGRIGAFAASAPHLAIELKPMQSDPDALDYDVDVYVQYVSDVATIEQDPSLRSIDIVRPPILAVASPSFLARSVRPLIPADLLGMPLLHEANYDQWNRWLSAQDVECSVSLSGPKFWQNNLTLAAARRGQGVALANALLASDDLRNGSLIALGPWKPVYLGGYRFTTRRNRWRDATVTSFRRWLQDMIGADLGRASLRLAASAGS